MPQPYPKKKGISFGSARHVNVVPKGIWGQPPFSFETRQTVDVDLIEPTTMERRSLSIRQLVQGRSTSNQERSEKRRYGPCAVVMGNKYLPLVQSQPILGQVCSIKDKSMQIDETSF